MMLEETEKREKNLKEKYLQLIKFIEFFGEQLDDEKLNMSSTQNFEELIESKFTPVFQSYRQFLGDQKLESLKQSLHNTQLLSLQAKEPKGEEFTFFKKRPERQSEAPPSKPLQPVLLSKNKEQQNRH